MNSDFFEVNACVNFYKVNLCDFSNEKHSRFRILNDIVLCKKYSETSLCLSCENTFNILLKIYSVFDFESTYYDKIIDQINESLKHCLKYDNFYKQIYLKKVREILCGLNDDVIGLVFEFL